MSFVGGAFSRPLVFSCTRIKATNYQTRPRKSAARCGEGDENANALAMSSSLALITTSTPRDPFCRSSVRLKARLHIYEYIHAVLRTTSRYIPLSVYATARSIQHRYPSSVVTLPLPPPSPLPSPPTNGLNGSKKN